MINLTDDNLRRLKEAFNFLSEYSDFTKSGAIYFSLDKSLSLIKESENPELYKEFKNFRAKFGFLALSILPEKNILDLFTNNLRGAFTIPNYNLWENLKKYLIGIPDYDSRDRIKLEIKNILLKNKTKVTKSNLILNQKEVTGTIENWLADYHINVGTGVVDRLAFEQYFINSPNIKELSPDESSRLKSLFQFYERLKLSSKSPQGFEEDVLIDVNGELKLWHEGRLEDFDPAVKKIIDEMEKAGYLKDAEIASTNIRNNKSNIEDLKQMLNKYPAGSLERKVIEEELEKMEGGGGGKKIN